MWKTDVLRSRRGSALAPVQLFARPELGLGLTPLPRIGAGRPDRVRDLALLERDLPKEDAAAHPGATVGVLHLQAEVVHLMRAAPGAHAVLGERPSLAEQNAEDQTRYRR